MTEKHIVRVAVDTTALAADKAYDYLVPSHLSHVQVGHRVLVPFGIGNTLKEAIVISFPDTSDYKKLKYIDAILDKEPVLNEHGMKLAYFVRDRSYATFYSVVKAMVPAGYWYKGKKIYERSPQFDANMLSKTCAGREPLLAVIAYLAANDEELSQEKLSEIMDSPLTPSLLNELKTAQIISEKTDIRPQVNEKSKKLYSLSELGYEAFSQNTIGGTMRNRVAEFLFSVGKASVKEIGYYTDASVSTVSTMVKKGLLDLCEEEVLRVPTSVSPQPKAEICLNDAQKEAFLGLSKLSDRNDAACALLHGVTGSGKTLVYIELLKHVSAQGKNGIVLVPEISLTPQLLGRFYAQFEGRVAVIHSALSVGERYDEWRRIRRGDVDVVIGTRSAVFAPIEDLGLIVIDEEHEHTYRSESMPRYHAVDAAKYRCKLDRALLLLGSATPSIESMYKAQSGVYAYYRLDERYGGAHMPQVIVSDTKKAFQNGMPGVIGPELYERLSDVLQKGEQAILLVNRRSMGKHLVCMDCGSILMCPNCSVALKYHMTNGRVICHQCGYSAKLPDGCDECCGTKLESVGIGTQLVENTLQELFPEAGIIRMDSDTTSGKNAHEKLLSAFADGKSQILLGTQMIAKGLDFENVTLSAVVDADAILYSGDWRGSEQAFSMMLQLTGRAGRGRKAGAAVIQTATPQNFVIEAAKRQDYMMFYSDEIEMRHDLKQPPFSKMVTFTVSGSIDHDAFQAARRVRSELEYRIRSAGLPIDILGPAPAAIQKLNNIYRYCITLRGRDSREMRDIVWEILLTYDRKKYGKTTVYADGNA